MAHFSGCWVMHRKLLADLFLFFFSIYLAVLINNNEAVVYGII